MSEIKPGNEVLSMEEEQFMQTVENMPSEELNDMMFHVEEQKHDMKALEDEDEEELADGEVIYADDIDPALLSGNKDMLQFSEEATENLPEAEEKKVISGRKRIIQYGGTPYETQAEIRFRALEAAKATKAMLNGKVIGAYMKKSYNGIQEVFFIVGATDGVYRGAEITIPGEKMTKILVWDGSRRSIEYMETLRRRWAKLLIHAEIQFCIESITVMDKGSVDERLVITGNRQMANEKMIDRYFDPEDPESLQVGDIVNGKILMVSNSRVVFSVAGNDLYLHSTIPYLTGVSRIIAGSSAKLLFEQNTYLECLIDSMRRDPETNRLNGLHVSFYEPVKKEIIRIIDNLQPSSYYGGTVLRYVPPKEDGKTYYLIVKADIGIEVLCFLPNWKRPPMPMDSVKLKLIFIRPQGKETLVIGSLKR